MPAGELPRRGPRSGLRADDGSRRHPAGGLLRAGPDVHAARRLPLPGRRPRPRRVGRGRAQAIVVDVHAEANAGSICWPFHLKGRVSAVLGTHTHVPTADEQILPGGTAFQCDVGMTGPYDSVLGRRLDRVLATTLTFVPSSFDVATGDPRLAGALVEVDAATGQATSIRRLMLDERGVAGRGNRKEG